MFFGCQGQKEGVQGSEVGREGGREEERTVP